jgi:hypothetical protein
MPQNREQENDRAVFRTARVKNFHPCANSSRRCRRNTATAGYFQYEPALAALFRRSPVRLVLRRNAHNMLACAGDKEGRTVNDIDESSVRRTG